MKTWAYNRLELAHALGYTLPEIDAMSFQQIAEWIAYFNIQRRNNNGDI